MSERDKPVPPIQAAGGDWYYRSHPQDAQPQDAQPQDAQQQEARDRLEKLQREMARISEEISSDSARKDSLQQQLREAEVELGRLQASMAENERAISASGEELAGLQQQRAVLEQARATQQTHIALELKTAWQLGQQSQLRVLLNQESPHTVARVLAYYRYFFQARNKLVEGYRETLRQLQELEQRIAGTLEQLAGQRSVEAEIEEFVALSGRGDSGGARFDRESTYADRVDGYRGA